MEAIKLLGTTTCPECGNAKAAILNDKRGNPYRACHWQTGGCGAQYFTRGEPKQTALLLAKVIAPNERSVPAPDPAKAADDPPQKKRAGVFDDLYGERAT